MQETLKSEITTAANHSQMLDIALVGNPNTGKTTVFNSLTGLRQKVGNYPGVTVEKKTGIMTGFDNKQARIHDLPGLYSLVPKSLDDKIAFDVLTNHSMGIDNLHLIIVVADAGNLSRNLYLVTQIIELGKPVILALNMMDSARAKGMEIDAEALGKELGIPVIPIVANKGIGLKKLRETIERFFQDQIQFQPKHLQLPQNLVTAALPVNNWLREHAKLNGATSKAEAVRVLTNDAALDNWLLQNGPSNNENHKLKNLVTNVREKLSQENITWQMVETKQRYNWIDTICKNVTHVTKNVDISFSEKLDKILTHKYLGPVIFLMIFGAIFQSIFEWAIIPMNAIATFIEWIGLQVAAIMPNGVLEDLIVNGVIAGVGAVLTFLPQILFLFFFLTLLEDTGYMSRAAFIMDRFMRVAGLSGRSVIPLLSSFACAIPGIMATRTINKTHDRLLTIMIAPLMSCSARLPVYTLLISAFIPQKRILGFLSLPGLTLLALYLLGILAAILAASVLKKFIRKNAKPSTFVMELPAYKVPSLKWTLLEMYERAKIFVTEAGKIILAISIVLWFLASYPKPNATENIDKSQAIEQSYAGQLGHIIEPVIKPLGFDWKIGIGLITAFAAREVIISTLSTIYHVEDGDNSSSLTETLRNARDPNTGKLVYSTLVAISLMVFFALACQCMSTVAIVRRETNSWRWPITMILYMTTLAYVMSFLVYQGGLLLGWG